ncbi:DNA recombination/repair protein RecA, partial [Candidatus Saccharibacteria bacterium]|nr:DNA recombination/repair protein RecA [Candidatus Saccharibacteria bacterium]
MVKKDGDKGAENKKTDGKNDALNLAIQQITKQFGDGSIMKLGETPKMDV